jgi:large subunit ribosomal protein L22
MAPRKIAVVAAIVRGRPVGEALSALQWTRRAAATPLKKLIESALANATNLGGSSVDVDRLWIKDIHVDQGPTTRRFTPRAQGRGTRINKKTSHLHVVLTDAAAERAGK